MNHSTSRKRSNGNAGAKRRRWSESVTLAGYGRVADPPVPGKGCALFLFFDYAGLIMRQSFPAERAAVVVAPLAGMAVGAGVLLLRAGLFAGHKEESLLPFDLHERHESSIAARRFEPHTSGMTRSFP